MPSRILNPTVPGSLLSPAVGDELTSQEELTVQAIAAGSYFVYNKTPSGTINGSNATFTLPSTPTPSTSLKLTLDGRGLLVGTDFTLSGSTITMIIIPQVGQTLFVPEYVVAP